MDWDLLLRFIAAGARIRRLPIFWHAFEYILLRRRILCPTQSVSVKSCTSLLANIPSGWNPESVQQLQDSYRLRSSLCAILLKLGLRY